MEEIKKLLETWKTEKGSFIPNAPIYGMFIKELEDAIEEQEQINKLTIPVVVKPFYCHDKTGGDCNYLRYKQCTECVIQQKLQ